MNVDDKFSLVSQLMEIFEGEGHNFKEDAKLHQIYNMVVEYYNSELKNVTSIDEHLKINKQHIEDCIKDLK